jgi:DNA-binding FadR family transcriptional regulator
MRDDRQLAAAVTASNAAKKPAKAQAKRQTRSKDAESGTDSKSKAKATRKSPKAASRIANLLRREIVTGALHAGDKLLPERVLQEQFQVSRPTLREAMRLLESESLIKISRGQHGGARVQKLDISVTARQVGMFLQMEGTTLVDVLQARTFLEPPAAGLIAESRSLAVIDKLRESVGLAKKAYEEGDPRALADAQVHFSEVLTSHAGNKTLSLFARLLHDIVHQQMTDVTVRTHSHEGVRKMQWLSIRGREKLIELIEQGKGEEAEKFWRLHLESTARVVLSSFRAQMPIDVLKDEV